MKIDTVDAVWDAIKTIQTTYTIQAPPGTKPPYFIVSIAGGPVDYFFSGALTRDRIQIAQYYKDNDLGQAIEDNEAIVNALDRKSLTDDGIIIMRLGEPIIRMLDGSDGRILQVVQDWEFTSQE